MIEMLFDSGWLGLSIGLVFLAAAFVGWSIKRYEFNRLWFLPGVAVILLFVGLDWAVETDREQLRNTTKLVIQAAEDEDADGLLANFSSRLQLDNGYDFAQAAGVIRGHLGKPLIASNMINELEITQVTENRGVVELVVSTVIDPESRYALARILRTSWRFSYGKDSDGRFRIVNMEMLTLNNGDPIDVFTYRP